jgi:cytoskeletal protein RodZ
MKKNQQGFGVVEVLLVLVVVLLLGIIGWYVFETRNNKPTPDNANSQVQATPDDESITEFKVPEGWVEHKYTKTGVVFGPRKTGK